MAEKIVIRKAVQRKFPTIGIDDSLDTAMNAMAEANVSVLAVKIGEEIAGLVTINDVMFSLANEDGLQTKISSFMTWCETDVSKRTRNPCLQLDEEEEALSAIKLMYDAGVNHLLVSGANDQIVGIVSSLELIKLLSVHPESLMHSSSGLI